MDGEPPAWALMTVALPPDDESLEAAARSLSVPVEAVDPTFGVTPLDREERLFAVQVRADALPAAESAGDYRGPFSNPRIAPFSMRE